MQNLYRSPENSRSDLISSKKEHLCWLLEEKRTSMKKSHRTARNMCALSVLCQHVWETFLLKNQLYSLDKQRWVTFTAYRSAGQLTLCQADHRDSKQWLQDWDADVRAQKGQGKTRLGSKFSCKLSERETAVKEFPLNL